MTSDRTYYSDLLNNLKIKPIHNPSYLCNDMFPSSCKNFAGQDKEKCRQFWTTICTNSNDSNQQMIIYNSTDSSNSINKH